MPEPQPYDVDTTDRLEVGRLRSAAKSGDQRAQATLDQIEQQKHTAKWEATEQARADRAAARDARRQATPSSVSGVMAKIKQEREEKETRRTANAEAVRATESKRRNPGGW